MEARKESSKTQGKPIRCRAAVARKAGEPLVIEEVTVAPPKSNEVRIRIICTCLCHSDITFWKLQEPLGHFPRIFGHEAVGMVESVGEGVHDFLEGDLVIPTFLADCGECRDCKSSKSNQCSKFTFEISPWMHREGTSRFSDINGDTIYHFAYVSSFIEYTVVDVTHLTKVDAEIPPDKACLLSCGVSTGIGAAWKAADVEPGSAVAIFGLGVIGLGVAEGARVRGAKRIIGVDLNPEKFEIGKKFGVTDFVNSKNCGSKSVSEVIIEMTGGGADYCFECVGLPTLMQEAYSCCRKGWGKTIVLGVEQPGMQLSLSSLVIAHSGKTLMGTLFGSLKPKTDIPMLAKSYVNKGWGKTILLGMEAPGLQMNLSSAVIDYSGKTMMGTLFGSLKPKFVTPMLAKSYMKKELQFDGFVTHEMEFEDINKALDLVVNGKTLTRDLDG